MYIIIWKYIVEFENQVEFELEYGTGGAWNSFFRKSKKYSGSHLILFDKSIGAYLLIDTWKNKESYENFIKKKEYSNINSMFEHLYLTEKRLK